MDHDRNCDREQGQRDKDRYNDLYIPPNNRFKGKYSSSIDPKMFKS